MWVYLLAPIGLALVIAHGGSSLSRPELLRRIAAQYIPFAVYAVAFRLAYTYVMPRLLPLAKDYRAELGLHVLAVLVIPPPLALVVHPILEAAEGLSVPYWRFTLVSIVISAACMWPAVLVQRLRLRTASAEKAAAEQRQAALQAQLDALQARTNPHFLFNSLNTVAALIPEDPEQAERAVERLSGLLRYGLSVSREQTVPLGQEIAMISDYLALQSARFGERLRARVELDDSLSAQRIPPLLLQPLVENAICHGASKGGDCDVLVQLTRLEKTMLFEVRDDGPGPGASNHTGTGSAIVGITERLRLHYGDRGRVELSKRPKGGCLAQLEIPLVGASSP